MGNQLDILISVHEEEKIKLQKMLNDCLADCDYLGAHQFSVALAQTDYNLYIYKKLDDPLYEKKLWQLRKIRDAESGLEKESSAFYEKQLLRAKQELERLNQVPKPNELPSSQSMLIVTLLRLMKNEIKNLKLILRKCDNLFLAFSYRTKTLKITLPQLKEHRKNRILNDYEIDPLQKLGFELTQNESKLTISLVGEKEELLSKVNRLMFKIVFDVFRYSNGFDNESYIQFTEKNGH